MHFHHQLSTLKNKLLQLENASSKQAHVCKHLFSKIHKQVSLVYIKRAIGATAFALLLQVLSSDAQAQNRAVFNFGTPQFNPFNIQTIPNAGVVFPSFADLDNDGDIDMIVAYGDTVAYQSAFLYFKNEGTLNNPSFGAPVNTIFANPVISEDFPFNAPVLVDLDGDGDMDIMVGGYDYDSYTYAGKFTYYQNIGTAANPSFAAGIDNPFGIVPSDIGIFWFPTMADIDGDGDQDMLASSYTSVMYYKNIGTATTPLFDAPIDLNSAFEISQQLSFNFPTFADLDNDGDIDLFINDYYNSKFLFFENTGTPTTPLFAAAVENPGNLTYLNGDFTPNFVKFDGDADMDLFTGSYTGVIYRENLQFAVGVKESLVKAIDIAPTVSQNVIQVLNLKNNIQQVAVYDMLGKTYNVDHSANIINISSLPAGQYHLRIIDNVGEVYTSPFIKQ